MKMRRERERQRVNRRGKRGKRRGGGKERDRKSTVVETERVDFIFLSLLDKVKG